VVKTPRHAVLESDFARAILQQPHGRFSAAEYARRRNALAEVARRNDCDALLLAGEQRSFNGVHWLTGWPTSTEAYVVFAEGERDVLHIEHYNHLPNARTLAPDADVRWASRRGTALPIEELKRRGARRVGFMGLLGWAKMRQLTEAFDLVDLGSEYARLRIRKSDEEIEWMRIGAALSDLGIQALHEEARPGMTERELGALVERPYHALGGSTSIHFIGVTSMGEPDVCVPPQHHSTRRIREGDVVFIELTAQFWDSPGQVLRSFTVGCEPTALYGELYAIAEAAFESMTAVLRAGVTPREIVAASALIEAAGFSTYDDILHGFGGGYWPPVLGSASRPAGPIPDAPLEANMTVVVQPNVITRDQKAGVQVGEMVRITAQGFERMHHAPWGFLRIG
jgi:Xaa-Pro aminopeptidase